MSERKIDQYSQINLHFSLALVDGTLVHSTFDGKPATMTVGDGSLLPGFEALLIGLAEGVDKVFRVHPGQGFGLWRHANVQRIPAARFALGEPPVAGLVLAFSGAGSTDLPGVVRSVTDEFVEVDFNHPLSGRDILFRVHIVSIVAARSPELIVVDAPAAVAIETH